MPISVVMPQMGESVAEGTIVRWIKRVGEPIGKDEPLFEISTDKVDAEIPSPDAGVLLEIRVQEGETVPIHTIVAIIGKEGETADAPVAPAGGDDVPAASGAAAETARGGSRGATADSSRSRLSPAVRRLAQEHGVDASQIRGSGADGRVTMQDVEAFVAARTHAPSGHAPSPGARTRVEKMSVMRRKIAEHMVQSAHTSPHIYSTYEVDFSRVDELRRKNKAEYESAGVRLTYTAFVAKATVDTIREFPFANASVDGDSVVYHEDINLAVAVALEQGLIAPVVHGADRHDLAGLSRAIQDLATRARTKQLKPEDVQGGTFTITNPGVFGGLFSLPIISQPQVAILAVGSIDKRAVVVDEAIVVRPTCHLTLAYDHRLIDGADGGRFLQALKNRLQNFDESLL